MSPHVIISRMFLDASDNPVAINLAKGTRDCVRAENFNRSSDAVTIYIRVRLRRVLYCAFREKCKPFYYYVR